ncbi:hypothetical protein OH492_23445 [Vibrio chagasii]|nr:hypothetical protein [Vibrio chagasii]
MVRKLRLKIVTKVNQWVDNLNRMTWSVYSLVVLHTLNILIPNRAGLGGVLTHRAKENQKIHTIPFR